MNAKLGRKSLTVGPTPCPFDAPVKPLFPGGIDERHIAVLCQECYAQARPTEYFPLVSRDSVCCGCGSFALVARVSRAEASRVGRSLFASGDLPTCMCYEPHVQSIVNGGTA